MINVQVEGRCLQSTVAATTVTSQGDRTPDWPAQPAAKPQDPRARPPTGTHHTQARWLRGKQTNAEKSGGNGGNSENH